MHVYRCYIKENSSLQRLHRHTPPDEDISLSCVFVSKSVSKSKYTENYILQKIRQPSSEQRSYLGIKYSDTCRPKKCTID